MAVTAEELEIKVKANVSEAIKGIEKLKVELSSMLQKNLLKGNGNISNTVKQMANSSSTSIEKLRKNLEFVDRQIEVQRNKVERLKQAYNDTFNTDKKNRLKDQIESANIQLDKMIEKSIGLADKINLGEGNNSITKATKNVAKQTKQATKNIKEMKKETNKLSKPLLNMGKAFRRILLFMAFRSAINQIKEGFQDLAKYSKNFNSTMSKIQSSLLQARNSLSTAFAPILEGLEPVLTKLINGFSSLMTTITMYTTALFTNSKTYIKATKATTDYATSIGKVNKELAKFDELNVLNDQNNGLPSAEDMFEEVAIPEEVINRANKIKEVWEELKPIIIGLTGALATFKIADETNKIVDWVNKLGKATGKTDKLTDSMLNKNKVLGQQTQQTQLETSALFNLVPALAGAAVGIGALREAINKLNSNPLEMPSIDAEGLNTQLDKAKETVNAFSNKVTDTSTNINTAVEEVKTQYQTLSPTISETNGKVIKGLITLDEGMKEETPKIKSTANKVALAITSGPLIAVSTISSKFTDLFNDTVKNGKAWGERLAENCGKAMESFADNVRGALSNAYENFLEFNEATSDEKSAKGGLNMQSWKYKAAKGLSFLGAVALPALLKALPFAFLADGGVLTQTTPLVAGEYPSAKRNPEIVTPQKIMYETNVKANMPVLNAIEEMTERLENAWNNTRVYAEIGYDKIKVGLDKENDRVGTQLYRV